MKFVDKNFYVFSIAKKQRAEVCFVNNDYDGRIAFLLHLFAGRGQDVWIWIQQQAQVFCEKCEQRRIMCLFLFNICGQDVWISKFQQASVL